MKIFFDECVLHPLRRLLTDHDVKTAQELGWGRLKNGELVAKADADGFAVFLTADQNLRHQQNITGRRMALVVLPTNYWPEIRAKIEKVKDVLSKVTDGEFAEVSF